jgi:hypothetical protein
VREVGADGTYRWKHDLEAAPQNTFALPSYVLRFAAPPQNGNSSGQEFELDVFVVEDAEELSEPTPRGSDTAGTSEEEEEEEDGECSEDHEAEVKGPIRVTYAERVAQLTEECESMQVVLEDPATADALVFPVDVESTVNESILGGNTRSFHDRFQHDFPTKLADFVRITSNIFVPPGQLHMKIHLDRATVVEDSMKLMALIQEKDVRVAFRIDFVNEKAVDAGGVYREWFLLLNEGLVKQDKGIFWCVDKDEQTFYLNPQAQQAIGNDYLIYFLASGRLVGRSLLEGNATGFHLSRPLLKIMLGQPLSFYDLEYFDPTAFKNMVWLLENQDVDALSLDFSVTQQVGTKVETIDLIPNGRNIPVTDSNKLAYVDRLFRYRLFDSVSPQLYAFLRGVYEVIPPELLLMFDSEELDLVLCGPDEVDVDDWERNTKYTSDLYKHPSRKWFWEIVREMPNEYRRRLLQFATGSSRVPSSGFSALTSYDGRLCPFTLKGIDLSDEGYVRSHACFNRLDLPRHTDKQKLKQILYAILNTEQHGFTTS